MSVPMPGRRWPVAIFVAVFALYLVSSSREPAWGDARGMWEVASRLVEDGAIDIKTRWPEDIPPGRDGKYYGIAPIGPSLVHVPGAALAQAVHATAPRHDVLVRPLATHLAPAALGALTAVLFFLLLLDLGIRARTASVCTAILACATTTWVYARMPYSEIVQLACFLGLFRQVLRTARAGERAGAAPAHAPEMERAGPAPARGAEMERAGPAPARGAEMERAGPAPARGAEMERAGPASVRGADDVEREGPAPAREAEVERADTTPARRSDPLRREALWLGVWAGCLFNAKYVFASAIVGGAVVIVWALRRDRAALARVAGWAAVTGGPLLGLALAYNYLRWGSITATGYEPYLDMYFGGSVFDGAWGMLLSPNKSALLYSPPLVLALIGLPRAVRAVPRLGFAMLAMVMPVFVIYCTYRSWSGDYAWGPRFFVWAVPVVLIPIAWTIDAAVRRWQRALVLAVVTAGVLVQLLGSALYWDHFIRVAIDTKNQWLGNPNRAGAYIPAKGRGHCDSCFEDTYELLWTPAFQPIHGHWWLVTSLARGDDARTAQARAPWRRYTTLDVNLAATYPRARIDWWGLLWLRDAPHTRAAGIAILILLTAALAFGVWLWLRLHRRSDGDSPADS